MFVSSSDNDTDSGVALTEATRDAFYDVAVRLLGRWPACREAARQQQPTTPRQPFLSPEPLACLFRAAFALPAL